MGESDIVGRAMRGDCRVLVAGWGGVWSQGVLFEVDQPNLRDAGAGIEGHFDPTIEASGRVCDFDDKEHRPG